MLSAAETPMSAFPQGMPYDNLADQEPVRDRQGGCLCRIVTEFCSVAHDKQRCPHLIAATNESTRQSCAQAREDVV